jgi:hypothetical protein
MRRIINLLVIVFAWFAAATQFYLALAIREWTTTEAIIHYFSYFTLITNLLVAVAFTREIFKPVPGKILTSITVYITIVGILYQILLRHLWEPTGLQKIIDVLLHTVDPILVVSYWILYRSKTSLKFHYLITWSVFPLLYLASVITMGSKSGFYPYPFINVTNLGFRTVFINSVALLLVLMAFSALYIIVGNYRNHTLPPGKHCA